MRILSVRINSAAAAGECCIRIVEIVCSAATAFRTVRRRLGTLFPHRHHIKMGGVEAMEMIFTEKIIQANARSLSHSLTSSYRSLSLSLSLQPHAFMLKLIRDQPTIEIQQNVVESQFKNSSRLVQRKIPKSVDIYFLFYFFPKMVSAPCEVFEVTSPRSAP